MRSVTARLLSIATGIILAAGIIAGAEPVGTAFTYHGQLKQHGIPVSDTADFHFVLFDAEAGGAQVSSILNKSNVTVNDGLFTAELDFGVPVFNGDARWMQIGVRVPAGGGTYTWLTARQPLTAVPYAVQTRGIYVDAAENVGIGTTSPAAKLHVDNGDLRVDGDVSLSGDVTYSPERTFYHNIPACSFQQLFPTDDAYVPGLFSGHIYDGSAPYQVFIGAPVHLPNNATVTELRVYYYDDTIIDLHFEAVMKRRPITALSSDNIALVEISTSGASSEIQSAIASPSGPATIDNSGFQYAVIVTWEPDGPSGSLEFYGCWIAYTVSTLSP